MTAPDQTATRVDPVKFEVIRNALSEATEEMAVALRHSAYSTNIKTRADFSCAFFDARMRPVAQSFSQPVHLGSMVNLVPISLQAYGPEKLGPGDAIVTNHPYVGGVHLNDVTVISPVHHEGKLMGYVASLAHHVDVGGGAPASVGAYREVYQEGIIIPPVRLLQSGEVVEDIFRLILSQIRSKHETAGDFRAQIAANNTGVLRLNALFDKQGSDTVVRYIDELIDYAERRTRHDLALLPRGVFEAEGIIDNDGFYRLVRIDAPLGTVVNCTDPSPVVGGWETQTRLIDVMLKALSGPLPERMPAGSKAMQCHAGFGGIAPDSGQYYCFLETLAGGYGGRAGLDGPDAVQCHGQNTENAPVEETERSYPVRILRYELVEDSDGPGEFRGGLGLRRDYSFDRHEATFSVLADRDREGPWGLFGGHAGRRAEYLLNPDGENPVKLGSKTTLDLSPGDVVSYRTCGGGGYGDPAKRDPQAVLIDVRDGKVSSARAREHYLVEIAADGRSIDEAATAALRAGHPGDTQNGGQA